MNDHRKTSLPRRPKQQFQEPDYDGGLTPGQLEFGFRPSPQQPPRRRPTPPQRPRQPFQSPGFSNSPTRPPPPPQRRPAPQQQQQTSFFNNAIDFVTSTVSNFVPAFTTARPQTPAPSRRPPAPSRRPPPTRRPPPPPPTRRPPPPTRRPALSSGGRRPFRPNNQEVASVIPSGFSSATLSNGPNSIPQDTNRFNPNNGNNGFGSGRPGSGFGRPSSAAARPNAGFGGSGFPPPTNNGGRQPFTAFNGPANANSFGAQGANRRPVSSSGFGGNRAPVGNGGFNGLGGNGGFGGGNSIAAGGLANQEGRDGRQFNGSPAARPGTSNRPSGGNRGFGANRGPPRGGNRGNSNSNSFQPPRGGRQFSRFEGQVPAHLRPSNNGGITSVTAPVKNRPAVINKFTGSEWNKFGPGGFRSFNDTMGPEVCQRPGLFRHPVECDKFYECYWDKWIQKYTLHVFPCPVVLGYDTDITACNWPFEGPQSQCQNS